MKSFNQKLKAKNQAENVSHFINKNYLIEHAFKYKLKLLNK